MAIAGNYTNSFHVERYSTLTQESHPGITVLAHPDAAPMSLRKPTLPAPRP